MRNLVVLRNFVERYVNVDYMLWKYKRKRCQNDEGHVYPRPRYAKTATGWGHVLAASLASSPCRCDE